MILSYPLTKAHSFDKGGRRRKGTAVAYSLDKDIYHCMTAYYKSDITTKGIQQEDAQTVISSLVLNGGAIGTEWGVIDTEWGLHWH